MNGHVLISLLLVSLNIMLKMTTVYLNCALGTRLKSFWIIGSVMWPFTTNHKYPQRSDRIQRFIQATDFTLVSASLNGRCQISVLLSCEVSWWSIFVSTVLLFVGVDDKQLGQQFTYLNQRQIINIMNTGKINLTTQLHPKGTSNLNKQLNANTVLSD